MQQQIGGEPAPINNSVFSIQYFSYGMMLAYTYYKPSCPCRRTPKYENSIKGEHMGSPLHSLIFVV